MYGLITIIKNLITSWYTQSDNIKNPINNQPNQNINNDISGNFDISILYDSFKYAKKSDIDQNYPLLIKALDERGILSRDMVIYCLATLEAENPWWKGITEKASKWSTKNRTKPYDFSNYVGKLGNKNLEEAFKFRGHGWLQLTGRSNFADMDSKLGLNGALLANPSLALQPEICAAIFAQYMADRIKRIAPALKTKDYIELRKIVNGGTHGLKRFKEKFIELDSKFPN